MSIKTCRHVLTPYSKGVQAVYCEKNVKYHYELDDNGNKIRVYDNFCAEHKYIIYKLED